MSVIFSASVPRFMRQPVQYKHDYISDVVRSPSLSSEHAVQNNYSGVVGGNCPANLSLNFGLQENCLKMFFLSESFRQKCKIRG